MPSSDDRASRPAPSPRRRPRRACWRAPAWRVACAELAGAFRGRRIERGGIEQRGAPHAPRARAWRAVIASRRASWGRASGTTDRSRRGRAFGHGSRPESSTAPVHDFGVRRRAGSFVHPAERGHGRFVLRCRRMSPRARRPARARRGRAAGRVVRWASGPCRCASHGCPRRSPRRGRRRCSRASAALRLARAGRRSRRARGWGAAVLLAGVTPSAWRAEQRLADALPPAWEGEDRPARRRRRRPAATRRTASRFAFAVERVDTAGRAGAAARLARVARRAARMPSAASSVAGDSRRRALAR